MCLDARKINKITSKQYDSPKNIDVLITKVKKNSIFTKLDLKNSFWLIPLHPESRKYCGFSVDGIVYQFKTVPFSLQSSTAALTCAMSPILDKFNNFCIYYVDDILILSENPEQHLKHIEIIHENLNEAGLKLNLKKCQFYQSKVQYLGYKITNQGIRIDQDRLKEIKNFPRPKTLKMIRGFLGMMNYYKKFIPRLAEKELTIIELLRKDEKWIWDERRTRVFEEIKEEFRKNLLLCTPDFTKEFILRCDATDFAIAAELLQEQDGVEVPICFISRILRNSEI